MDATPDNLAFTLDFASVPEPSTLALFGFACLASRGCACCAPSLSDAGRVGAEAALGGTEGAGANAPSALATANPIGVKRSADAQTQRDSHYLIYRRRCDLKNSLLGKIGGAFS